MFCLVILNMDQLDLFVMRVTCINCIFICRIAIKSTKYCSYYY